MGAPFGPSLTKILTQGQWALTVFPLTGGRRLPPRGKDRSEIVLIPATLTVAIASSAMGTTMTFAGVPQANLNLSVIIQHPAIGKQYLYYQTQAGDTLVSIAYAVFQLISGLTSPIVCTVSGPVVTIISSLYSACHIGTTGTVLTFASRFEQRIQVSTWTPNASSSTNNLAFDENAGLRASVCDAIISNVGTDMNMWYDLPDATALRLRLSALPTYIDDSQTDYNLYVSHMIFLAEYTLVSSNSATQVGVIEEATSIGGATQVITIGG
jgi:hypothetical protein